MKQIDPNLLATEETLHNNNTAAELARHGNVLNSLLSDIPVAVAPPLVAPSTYDYTKTFRYTPMTYGWKFSLNPVGPVTAPLVAAKGGVSMLNTSNSNLTLGPLEVTKDGLLAIKNQLGCRATAMIKGSGQQPDVKNAVYPRTVWMVQFKPNYFMSEKQMEDDFYGATQQGNTGVRFTNDNDAAHTFVNAIFPVDGYSLWQYNLTTIPGNTDKVNIDLWINGVQQTNSVAVQTYYRKFYCCSVGTGESNSDHYGVAEVFHTGILDAPTNLKITNEILAEYGIGKPFPLPFATNVVVNKVNGNYVVSFTPNMAIDPNATVYQWIDWNGQGPAGAKYRPDLSGPSVPANFSGGVQVTVHNLQGVYFGIPAMAATPN
jgi:hypothetical protein